MDVRAAAAKVIGNLLQQQNSLAGLLPLYQAKVAEKDRPLLQELCYGTARWQPQLQCYLEQLLEKPLRNKDSDVHGLLLIGLYQLITLRVPDHAAINTTVSAAAQLKKPWAKGLTNGVLRRFLREKTAIEARIENSPAFISAHPAWLEARIRTAWPDHADEIVAQNNQRPPFCLRVNQQRTNRTDYLAQLIAKGMHAEATHFSDVGLILDAPVNVELLPGFADGWVSVQDEAAQLCASLLNLAPGLSVLDACSAPGGKTAHMLEHEPQLQRLVALDISEQRLQRVRDNLQRLQITSPTELIAADASQPNTWWDGELFDRILIDAPCSATGIIRRQPDIKILRTPEQIAALIETQNQILAALWPLLKPGGLLVYATCSILPCENSERMAHFIAATPDAEAITINADWGITQPYGRQLFPQARGHDGFYYAKLTKKSAKQE